MTDPNIPQPPQAPGYQAQPAAPGYQAPAAPGAAPEYAQPLYGAPQTNQKTNVLAIVSLILAFVFSIGGIVCGHIALSQIKKTGEQGRGLALAGTILGYVFTFGSIVAFIFMFALSASLSAGFDYL